MKFLRLGNSRNIRPSAAVALLRLRKECSDSPAFLPATVSTQPPDDRIALQNNTIKDLRNVIEDMRRREEDVRQEERRSRRRARRWAIEEPSVEPIEETSAEPAMDPADVERLLNPRVRLGKRVSRAVARFLIIFCIGVVATLAWQSYGDATREMIASSSPQGLGWLAPSAAPAMQAVAPPDQDDLKAISFGLAGMRQRVDQIAAQFVAGQEQTTRDIAELHATEQDILANILDKISAPPPRPAAAPVRKPAPAPLTPPAPQAPPVR